jgi:hypothetical protein
MMKEYVGHLHLHSTYSDGTATIEEIVAEARNAGLAFVGINDHHHLDGLYDGKEGWSEGVAVLIGCEINDVRNHYLAYNIDREIDGDALRPQNVIDAVHAQGGLGFIAHPFERGSPLWDKGRTFGWSDWQVRDFTGIEIWNFCSLFRANSPNLPQALFRYYFMRSARLDPLPETLDAWDLLSRKRKIVAIGGSDNHGFRTRTLGGLVPVRLFDYRIALRSVHTHVLLHNDLPVSFKAAKTAIMEALAEGRCFVALHLFDDPCGFHFEAETRRGSFNMGDEVVLSDAPVLRVQSPLRGIIRIIRDGELVSVIEGRVAEIAAHQTGSYRVEVRRPRILGGTRAWIFSNAIRVSDAPGGIPAP